MQMNAWGRAAEVLGVSVEKGASSPHFQCFFPVVTEIKCKQYSNFENQVFSQRKILPNGAGAKTLRMAPPLRERTDVLEVSK